MNGVKIPLKALILFMVAFSIYASNGLAFTGTEIYTDYRVHKETVEKAIGDYSADVIMENVVAGNAVVGSKMKIYKKGNKRREEVFQSARKKTGMPPIAKTVMIDDGTTKYSFSPAFGVTTGPSETDIETTINDVEFIRTDKVDDEECFVIRTGYQEGEEKTLWISTKDSRLLRKDLIEPNGTKTTTVYRDFKRINGQQVAHTHMIYTNEKPSMRLKLKYASTNPSIPDKLFDPKQVEGPDGKPYIK